MTMDLPTAIDILDVLLDELVTLMVLPVKRYEDMSAEQREKLVKLLVKRYGETIPDAPTTELYFLQQKRIRFMDEICRISERIKYLEGLLLTNTTP